jgi:hypothetical protein
VCPRGAIVPVLGGPWTVACHRDDSGADQYTAGTGEHTHHGRRRGAIAEHHTYCTGYRVSLAGEKRGRVRRQISARLFNNTIHINLWGRIVVKRHVRVRSPVTEACVVEVVG